MQKIHITTVIKASPEKVWKTMLDDATYRQWTNVFSPGSYYKGSWEKGSKILFLGPSADGSGEGGMVSRIAESRPYEFLSIEHLGVVENGVENTSSEISKDWAGAHENYTFKEVDGGTEFTLDMDTTDEQKAEMEAMWKKGLVKLKELAEK